MSVLKELLSLFQSKQSLQAVSEDFSQMLDESLALIRRGGAIFFRHANNPDEAEQVRKQDVRVNKAERRIRKQVLAHLSARPGDPDLSYCLVMINLVKDVERIGDYAKELVDLVSLTNRPLPEDELVNQLLDIRTDVETDFRACCEVIRSGDQSRAVALIRAGRAVVERCEALIQNIARSPHDAGTVAKLILSTRYYQRIAGHILNLLSSIVMPLHKIDYYDEDDLAKAAEQRSEPHAPTPGRGGNLS